MSNFSDGHKITRIHKSVAEQITEWIRNNADDRTPITYKQLCDRVDIDRQFIGRFLGSLSTECHAHGWPLISVIVVHPDTGLPDAQFLVMADRIGRSDVEIEEESRRVFAHDWQQFMDFINR